MKTASIAILGCWTALAYCALTFSTRAGEPVTKKLLDENSAKKQYAASKTWQEKRSVCLQAVDDGVIRRHMEIATIPKIFEEDAKVITGDPSSKCTISVMFEKQKPSSDSRMAAAYAGWYLIVMSDVNGNIEKYWLSNTHK